MPIIQENNPLSLELVTLFQGLPPVDLEFIRSILQEREFVKGEMISMEGSPCDKVVIVQHGRIKLFRSSTNGREQILEVLEKGDTCACNPGSQEWCCPNYVQALTDCKVWVFNPKEYTRLVHSNPRIMQQLTRIFAQRLCRFSQLIEDVALEDSMTRLIKFILNQVEAQNSNESSPRVNIRYTHDEIAQRLGLARETVTRHLNRLKREQYIDILSNQIVILNQEGLKTCII